MGYLMLFIAITVLIIWIIRQSSGTNNREYGQQDVLKAVIDEVKLLRKEVRQLREEIDEGRRIILNELKVTKFKATVEEPGDVKHETVTTPDVEETAEIRTPEQPLQETVYNESSDVRVQLETIESDEVINIADPNPDYIRPLTLEPEQEEQMVAPAAAQEEYPESSTDIEKFIGENLINKIGIAVLVLGIAFFVKYAIDQNWINEVGRVCIGLLCGSLLLGIAHYLRKNYRSFSSVLSGGGIAVYYFTIAFAFHQYHLMSQTATFAVMVVITIFAISLSVLYDKLELAVIAVVGGFITPFLVSTGEGNYQVLFTYLIILNAGTLALSYFKRWPLINFLSLAFTQLIFGGWLTSTLNSGKPFSKLAALGFASAYYVMFLGMNMLHQLKNKQYFKAFDFSILLFISSVFYAAGMAILHVWDNGAYQGLFTLAMAVVNLALSWIVFKQSKPDKNLLFLLIGITLTFVTLTIPIQLHGHAITMFWSAEFVLLYWLAGYSGIRLYKYSSLIVCGLSIVSLMLDWQQAGLADKGNLVVIYTGLQGIVTNIISIAAFAGYSYLLAKDEDGNVLEISTVQLSRLALFTYILFLYLTCVFGVNLYFSNISTYDIPNIYHRLITGLFAIAIMTVLQHRANNTTPWIQLFILPVYFVYYLSSQIYIGNVRYGVLVGTIPFGHLVAHWASGALLIVLFVHAVRAVRTHQVIFAVYEKGITIMMTLVALTLLSLEISHIFILFVANKNNVQVWENQYLKAGLTVIWGISSFVLMWLGMKYSKKIMRVISLVLFGIVLFKLFIFDIADISEGGKILAFILLGVLLLTVSFMYQKLKKIIIDDKTPTNNVE